MTILESEIERYKRYPKKKSFGTGGRTHTHLIPYVAETSQIFVGDTHIIPKRISCEKYVLQI
jgi:hypothetical protein